jgi:hypothetical protein
MEYMANFAYLLYLLAYAVRDMLWLRLITIVAASLTVPYYYFQGEGPLWTPMLWAVLFGGINAFQIGWLILDRRPVGLGADERALYDTVFWPLNARAFVKLAALAEWIDADAGDDLVAAGDVPDRLLLLSSGDVQVCLATGERFALRPGQFIGALAFMTDRPASARVAARGPTRCMAWPAARLRGFLRKRPELATAMQRILGADVVVKLQERNMGAREPPLNRQT